MAGRELQARQYRISVRQDEPLLAGSDTRQPLRIEGPHRAALVPPLAPLVPERVRLGLDGGGWKA